MKKILLVGMVCLLAVTALIHAEEEPACWSCPCQPYGDANCDGFIAAVDVQYLLSAWINGYDPCSDFNHDGYITAIDVQIMLDSWATGGTIDCPMT